MAKYYAKMFSFKSFISRFKRSPQVVEVTPESITFSRQTNNSPTPASLEPGKSSRSLTSLIILVSFLTLISLGITTLALALNWPLKNYPQLAEIFQTSVYESGSEPTGETPTGPASTETPSTTGTSEITAGCRETQTATLQFQEIDQPSQNVTLWFKVWQTITNLFQARLPEIFQEETCDPEYTADGPASPIEPIPSVTGPAWQPGADDPCSRHSGAHYENCVQAVAFAPQATIGCSDDPSKVCGIDWEKAYWSGAPIDDKNPNSPNGDIDEREYWQEDNHQRYQDYYIENGSDPCAAYGGDKDDCQAYALNVLEHGFAIHEGAIIKDGQIVQILEGKTLTIGEHTLTVSDLMDQTYRQAKQINLQAQKAGVIEDILIQSGYDIKYLYQAISQAQQNDQNLLSALCPSLDSCSLDTVNKDDVLYLVSAFSDLEITQPQIAEETAATETPAADQIFQINRDRPGVTGSGTLYSLSFGGTTLQVTRCGNNQICIAGEPVEGLTFSQALEQGISLDKLQTTLFRTPYSVSYPGAPPEISYQGQIYALVKHGDGICLQGSGSKVCLDVPGVKYQDAVSRGLDVLTLQAAIERAPIEANISLNPIDKTQLARVEKDGWVFYIDSQGNVYSGGTGGMGASPNNLSINSLITTGIYDDLNPIQNSTQAVAQEFFNALIEATIKIKKEATKVEVEYYYPYYYTTAPRVTDFDYIKKITLDIPETETQAPIYLKPQKDADGYATSTLEAYTTAHGYEIRLITGISFATSKSVESLEISGLNSGLTNQFTEAAEKYTLRLEKLLDNVASPETGGIPLEQRRQKVDNCAYTDNGDRACRTKDKSELYDYVFTLRNDEYGLPETNYYLIQKTNKEGEEVLCLQHGGLGVEDCGAEDEGYNPTYFIYDQDLPDFTQNILAIANYNIANDYYPAFQEQALGQWITGGMNLGFLDIERLTPQSIEYYLTNLPTLSTTVEKRPNDLTDEAWQKVFAGETTLVSPDKQAQPGVVCEGHDCYQLGIKEYIHRKYPQLTKEITFQDFFLRESPGAAIEVGESNILTPDHPEYETWVKSWLAEYYADDDCIGTIEKVNSDGSGYGSCKSGAGDVKFSLEDIQAQALKYSDRFKDQRLAQDTLETIRQIFPDFGCDLVSIDSCSSEEYDLFILTYATALEHESGKEELENIIEFVAPMVGYLAIGAATGGSSLATQISVDLLVDYALLDIQTQQMSDKELEMYSNLATAFDSKYGYGTSNPAFAWIPNYYIGSRNPAKEATYDILNPVDSFATKDTNFESLLQKVAPEKDISDKESTNYLTYGAMLSLIIPDSNKPKNLLFDNLAFNWYALTPEQQELIITESLQPEFFEYRDTAWENLDPKVQAQIVEDFNDRYLGFYRLTRDSLALTQTPEMADLFAYKELTSEEVGEIFALTQELGNYYTQIYQDDLMGKFINDPYQGAAQTYTQTYNLNYLFGAITAGIGNVGGNVLGRVLFDVPGIRKLSTEVALAKTLPEEAFEFTLKQGDALVRQPPYAAEVIQNVPRTPIQALSDFLFSGPTPAEVLDYGDIVRVMRNGQEIAFEEGGDILLSHGDQIITRNGQELILNSQNFHGLIDDEVRHVAEEAVENMRVATKYLATPETITNDVDRQVLEAALERPMAIASKEVEPLVVEEVVEEVIPEIAEEATEEEIEITVELLEEVALPLRAAAGEEEAVEEIAQELTLVRPEEIASEYHPLIEAADNYLKSADELATALTTSPESAHMSLEQAYEQTRRQYEQAYREAVDSFGSNDPVVQAVSDLTTACNEFNNALTTVDTPQDILDELAQTVSEKEAQLIATVRTAPTPVAEAPAPPVRAPAAQPPTAPAPLPTPKPGMVATVFQPIQNAASSVADGANQFFSDLDQGLRNLSLPQIFPSRRFTVQDILEQAGSEITLAGETIPFTARSARETALITKLQEDLFKTGIIKLDTGQKLFWDASEKELKLVSELDPLSRYVFYDGLSVREWPIIKDILGDPFVQPTLLEDYGFTARSIAPEELEGTLTPETISHYRQQIDDPDYIPGSTIRVFGIYDERGKLVDGFIVEQLLEDRSGWKAGSYTSLINIQFNEEIFSPLIKNLSGEEQIKIGLATKKTIAQIQESAFRNPVPIPDQAAQATAVRVITPTPGPWEKAWETLVVERLRDLDKAVQDLGLLRRQAAQPATSPTTPAAKVTFLDKLLPGSQYNQAKKSLQTTVSNPNLLQQIQEAYLRGEDPTPLFQQAITNWRSNYSVTITNALTPQDYLGEVLTTARRQADNHYQNILTAIGQEVIDDLDTELNTLVRQASNYINQPDFDTSLLPKVQSGIADQLTRQMDSLFTSEQSIGSRAFQRAKYLGFDETTARTIANQIERDIAASRKELVNQQLQRLKDPKIIKIRAIPERTEIAIGDIHGDWEQAEKILRGEVAGQGTSTRPPIIDEQGQVNPNVVVHFMGDYVDRAPAGQLSVLAAENVRRLQQQAGSDQVKAYLGNHEVILVRAMNIFDLWLQQGKSLEEAAKLATITAYNFNLDPQDILYLHGHRDLLEWIKNLPAIDRSGSTLYFHSNSLDYRWYGSTIEEINQNIRTILHNGEATFIDGFGNRVTKQLVSGSKDNLARDLTQGESSDRVTTYLQTNIVDDLLEHFSRSEGFSIDRIVHAHDPFHTPVDPRVKNVDQGMTQYYSRAIFGDANYPDRGMAEVIQLIPGQPEETRIVFPSLEEKPLIPNLNLQVVRPISPSLPDSGQPVSTQITRTRVIPFDRVNPFSTLNKAKRELNQILQSVEVSSEVRRFYLGTPDQTQALRQAEAAINRALTEWEGKYPAVIVQALQTERTKVSKKVVTDIVVSNNDLYNQQLKSIANRIYTSIQQAFDDFPKIDIERIESFPNDVAARGFALVELDNKVFRDDWLRKTNPPSSAYPEGFFDILGQQPQTGVSIEVFINLKLKGVPDEYAALIAKHVEQTLSQNRARKALIRPQTHRIQEVSTGLFGLGKKKIVIKKKTESVPNLGPFLQETKAKTIGAVANTCFDGMNLVEGYEEFDKPVLTLWDRVKIIFKNIWNWINNKPRPPEIFSADPCIPTIKASPKIIQEPQAITPSLEKKTPLVRIRESVTNFFRGPVVKNAQIEVRFDSEIALAGSTEFTSVGLKLNPGKIPGNIINPEDSLFVVKNPDGQTVLATASDLEIGGRKPVSITDIEAIADSNKYDVLDALPPFMEAKTITLEPPAEIPVPGVGYRPKNTTYRQLLGNLSDEQQTATTVETNALEILDRTLKLNPEEGHAFKLSSDTFLPSLLGETSELDKFLQKSLPLGSNLRQTTLTNGYEYLQQAIKATGEHLAGLPKFSFDLPQIYQDVVNVHLIAIEEAFVRAQASGKPEDLVILSRILVQSANNFSHIAEEVTVIIPQAQKQLTELYGPEVADLYGGQLFALALLHDVAQAPNPLGIKSVSTFAGQTSWHPLVAAQTLAQDIDFFQQRYGWSEQTAYNLVADISGHWGGERHPLYRTFGMDALREVSGGEIPDVRTPAGVVFFEGVDNAAHINDITGPDFQGSGFKKIMSIRLQVGDRTGIEAILSNMETGLGNFQASSSILGRNIAIEKTADIAAFMRFLVEPDWDDLRRIAPSDSEMNSLRQQIASVFEPIPVDFQHSPFENAEFLTKTGVVDTIADLAAKFKSLPPEVQLRYRVNDQGIPLSELSDEELLLSLNRLRDQAINRITQSNKYLEYNESHIARRLVNSIPGMTMTQGPVERPFLTKVGFQITENTKITIGNKSFIVGDFTTVHDYLEFAERELAGWVTPKTKIVFENPDGLRVAATIKDLAPDFYTPISRDFPGLAEVTELAKKLESPKNICDRLPDMKVVEGYEEFDKPALSFWDKVRIILKNIWNWLLGKPRPVSPEDTGKVLEIFNTDPCLSSLSLLIPEKIETMPHETKTEFTLSDGKKLTDVKEYIEEGVTRTPEDVAAKATYYAKYGDDWVFVKVFNNPQAAQFEFNNLINGRKLPGGGILAEPIEIITTSQGDQAVVYKAYLNSTTLWDYLATGRTISPELRADTLENWDLLLKNGYIHGDINPENVLVIVDEQLQAKQLIIIDPQQVPTDAELTAVHDLETLFRTEEEGKDLIQKILEAKPFDCGPLQGVVEGYEAFDKPVLTLWDRVRIILKNIWNWLTNKPRPLEIFTTSICVPLSQPPAPPVVSNAAIKAIEEKQMESQYAASAKIYGPEIAEKWTYLAQPAVNVLKQANEYEYLTDKQLKRALRLVNPESSFIWDDGRFLGNPTTSSHLPYRDTDIWKTVPAARGEGSSWTFYVNPESKLIERWIEAGKKIAGLTSEAENLFGTPFYNEKIAEIITVIDSFEKELLEEATQEVESLREAFRVRLIDDGHPDIAEALGKSLILADKSGSDAINNLARITVGEEQPIFTTAENGSGILNKILQEVREQVRQEHFPRLPGESDADWLVRLEGPEQKAEFNRLVQEEWQKQVISLRSEVDGIPVSKDQVLNAYREAVKRGERVFSATVVSKTGLGYVDQIKTLAAEVAAHNLSVGENEKIVLIIDVIQSFGREDLTTTLDWLTVDGVSAVVITGSKAGGALPHGAVSFVTEYGQAFVKNDQIWTKYGLQATGELEIHDALRLVDNLHAMKGIAKLGAEEQLNSPKAQAFRETAEKFFEELGFTILPKDQVDSIIAMTPPEGIDADAIHGFLAFCAEHGITFGGVLHETDAPIVRYSISLKMLEAYPDVESFKQALKTLKPHYQEAVEVAQEMGEVFIREKPATINSVFGQVYDAVKETLTKTRTTPCPTMNLVEGYEEFDKPVLTLWDRIRIIFKNIWNWINNKPRPAEIFTTSTCLSATAPSSLEAILREEEEIVLSMSPAEQVLAKNDYVLGLELKDIPKGSRTEALISLLVGKDIRSGIIELDGSVEKLVWDGEQLQVLSELPWWKRILPHKSIQESLTVSLQSTEDLSKKIVNLPLEISEPETMSLPSSSRPILSPHIDQQSGYTAYFYPSEQFLTLDDAEELFGSFEKLINAKSDFEGIEALKNRLLKFALSEQELEIRLTEITQMTDEIRRTSAVNKLIRGTGILGEEDIRQLLPYNQFSDFKTEDYQSFVFFTDEYREGFALYAVSKDPSQAPVMYVNAASGFDQVRKQFFSQYPALKEVYEEAVEVETAKQVKQTEILERSTARTYQSATSLSDETSISPKKNLCPSMYIVEGYEEFDKPALTFWDQIRIILKNIWNWITNKPRPPEIFSADPCQIPIKHPLEEITSEEDMKTLPGQLRINSRFQLYVSEFRAWVIRSDQGEIISYVLYNSSSGAVSLNNLSGEVLDDPDLAVSILAQLTQELESFSLPSSFKSEIAEAAGLNLFQNTQGRLYHFKYGSQRMIASFPPPIKKAAKLSGDSYPFSYFQSLLEGLPETIPVQNRSMTSWSSEITDRYSTYLLVEDGQNVAAILYDPFYRDIVSLLPLVEEGQADYLQSALARFGERMSDLRIHRYDVLNLELELVEHLQTTYPESSLTKHLDEAFFTNYHGELTLKTPPDIPAETTSSKTPQRTFLKRIAAVFSPERYAPLSVPETAVVPAKISFLGDYMILDLTLPASGKKVTLQLNPNKAFLEARSGFKETLAELPDEDLQVLIHTLEKQSVPTRFADLTEADSEFFTRLDPLIALRVENDRLVYEPATLGFHAIEINKKIGQGVEVRVADQKLENVDYASLVEFLENFEIRPTVYIGDEAYIYVFPGSLRPLSDLPRSRQIIYKLTDTFMNLPLIKNSFYERRLWPHDLKPNDLLLIDEKPFLVTQQEDKIILKTITLAETALMTPLIISLAPGVYEKGQEVINIAKFAATEKGKKEITLWTEEFQEEILKNMSYKPNMTNSEYKTAYTQAVDKVMDDPVWRAKIYTIYALMGLFGAQQDRPFASELMRQYLWGDKGYTPDDLYIVDDQRFTGNMISSEFTRKIIQDQVVLYYIENDLSPGEYTINFSFVASLEPEGRNLLTRKDSSLAERPKSEEINRISKDLVDAISHATFIVKGMKIKVLEDGSIVVQELGTVALRDKFDVTGNTYQNLYFDLGYGEIELPWRAMWYLANKTDLAHEVYLGSNYLPLALPDSSYDYLITPQRITEFKDLLNDQEAYGNLAGEFTLPIKTHRKINSDFELWQPVGYQLQNLYDQFGITHGFNGSKLVPTGTIVMYDDQPYEVVRNTRVGGWFYRWAKIQIHNPETGELLIVEPEDLEVATFDGLNLPQEEAEKSAMLKKIREDQEKEREFRNLLEQQREQETITRKNEAISSIIDHFLLDSKTPSSTTYADDGDAQFAIEEGAKTLATLNDPETKKTIINNLRKKGYSKEAIETYSNILDYAEENLEKISKKAHQANWEKPEDEEVLTINMIMAITERADPELELLTVVEEQYFKDLYEDLKFYTEEFTPSPEPMSNLEADLSENSLEYLETLSGLRRLALNSYGETHLNFLPPPILIEAITKAADDPLILEDLKIGAREQDSREPGNSENEKNLNLILETIEFINQNEEVFNSINDSPEDMGFNDRTRYTNDLALVIYYLQEFLVDQQHYPYVLKDLEEAVERLKEQVEQNSEENYPFPFETNPYSDDYFYLYEGPR